MGTVPRYLARELAALPVLLVVTYRADELTRRHPFYQVLPAGDCIVLRPAGLGRPS